MKTRFEFSQRLTRCSLLWLALQITPVLAAGKLQEEFHQTYPTTADGQFKLDNVNGRVRITAWDRAEIQVDFVKRADTKKDLDATKVEIDATDTKVTVHTRLPKWKSSEWGKSDSASVEYEIKVPARIRLGDVQTVNGDLEIKGVVGQVKASTVNGRLTAKGLAADTKLESVNGRIESSFDSLESVKSMSLQTVNGKVNVTLPTKADVQISASTVNGHIQANNLTVKKNWPIGSELHAKLGDGRTRLKVETVNGGIQISTPDSVQPAVLEKAD